MSVLGFELTFHSCLMKNSNDKNLLVLVSPKGPPWLDLVDGGGGGDWGLGGGGDRPFEIL